MAIQASESNEWMTDSAFGPEAPGSRATLIHPEMAPTTPGIGDLLAGLLCLTIVLVPMGFYAMILAGFASIAQ